MGDECGIKTITLLSKNYLGKKNILDNESYHKNSGHCAFYFSKVKNSYEIELDTFKKHQLKDIYI